MALTLHYFPTPNGHKISIALEEMRLDYQIVIVHILKGEQQSPGFLELSPNGRIPALSDDTVAGGRVQIFESGAILQYLARKTGLFYAADEARRCAIDGWLFWQMSGLGPMSGQVNWFTRAANTPGRDPRDCAYALHRYTREVKRLYGVLERQLGGRDYICDDYSIADMACWPWIDKYHGNVGDLGQYPQIQAWRERIAARPAVQRALQVGTAGL
jgi:GST-like protein